MARLSSVGLYAVSLLACSTSPAVSPGDGGVVGDSGAFGNGGMLDAAADGAISPTIDAARPVADGASPICGDAAAPWSDPGAAPPALDPSLGGAVHHFYAIKVLDETQTPIVGATLTTTNHIIYETDNHGAVGL